MPRRCPRRPRKQHLLSSFSWQRPIATGTADSIDGTLSGDDDAAGDGDGDGDGNGDGEDDDDDDDDEQFTADTVRICSNYLLQSIVYVSTLHVNNLST